MLDLRSSVQLDVGMKRMPRCGVGRSARPVNASILPNSATKIKPVAKPWGAICAGSYRCLPGSAFDAVSE